jgi:hypothetical protein
MFTLFLFLTIFAAAFFQGMRNGDAKMFFRQSANSIEDERHMKTIVNAAIAYCAVVMIWLTIAYMGSTSPQQSLMLQRSTGRVSAHAGEIDRIWFAKPSTSHPFIKHN